MSVKPVESIPKKEVNQKLEMMKEDLREIIEKRITMAEIVDSPYPVSSMREKMTTAIRKVVWEYAKERKTNHVPTISGVLDFTIRKVDGEYHCYVTFDPEQWDAEWEEIYKVEKSE